MRTRTNAAKHLLVAVCSMVVFALVHSSAWAQNQPRVALVNDPTDVHILPRLRAELNGLGFRVIERDLPPNEKLPRDLVEAARTTGAMVAFRVVVSNEQVDVWIADRVTGKVVLRELLAKDAQRMEAHVVVLRAVELLRVSLMELDAPYRPRGEVTAPEVVAQGSALLDSWDRFSLGLTSFALASTGGFNAAWGVEAGLTWRPSWLGVRLVGGSALSPSQMTASEGSGEIRTRFVALDLLAQPRAGWGRLRPRVSLGACYLFHFFQGLAESPRSSLSANQFSFSPSLAIDLSYALSRHLHVHAGVRYLRPLHTALIEFDNRVVGTFGENLFLASLGLDFVLF